jgi:hypothetical protein
VSGQLHAPAALPSWKKSPWYPLDRRLGGSQSLSGRGGEEKNSQPPPGIEPYNPDRPARSPALYRLSYHGSHPKKEHLVSIGYEASWAPALVGYEIVFQVVTQLRFIIISCHWTPYNFRSSENVVK